MSKKFHVNKLLNFFNRSYSHALRLLESCKHQILKVNELKYMCYKVLEGPGKTLDRLNLTIRAGNKFLLLERAKIYYKNGKYEHARDDCNNFIKVFIGKKIHFGLHLGHAYNLQGRYLEILLF